MQSGRLEPRPRRPHYRTFSNWMARGEAGRRRYFHFFQAVIRAEIEVEAALVRTWSYAARIDCRAAGDMPTRRFPERWMPQNKQKVSDQTESHSWFS